VPTRIGVKKDDVQHEVTAGQYCTGGFSRLRDRGG